MSLNSFIAGLNLPFALSETQFLNAIAWASNLEMFYLSWPGSGFKQSVEREAGQIVEMPPGKLGEITTLAHTVGLFVPALAILFGLPTNQFLMPALVSKAALPPIKSEALYYGLRVAGCVGYVGVGITMRWGMKHLGTQWHIAGLRERPKLVKTGPYAYLRHPMYLTGMFLNIFSGAMYWNWLPLAGAALAVPAFLVKIPIEEQVILDNKQIGDAYKRYKKEVPYRVVPYIW